MVNNPTNRLNTAESRVWDRCFIYFVRTGEWPMGMSDDKHFIEPLDIEDVAAAPKDVADLIMMDKNPAPFVEPLGTMNMRKPISLSDGALEKIVTCLRSTCVANHKKKCTMPSRINIRLDGKCQGYQDPNGNTK